MIPKGYRLSIYHIVFYVSTFVIATQLWSVWRQSSGSIYSRSQAVRTWDFNADVHANVHTLSHEQCDMSFPKLYHSLDKSVKLRQGRKVDLRDIEIRKGRCMLRVMVYQGEVREHYPAHVSWLLLT
jgi:protein glucosyltransferase